MPNKNSKSETLILAEMARNLSSQGRNFNQRLLEEVAKLLRENARLNHLVEIRSRERDGAKQAHKKKLVQARRLRKYVSKLERKLTQMQQPKRFPVSSPPASCFDFESAFGSDDGA